jgi:hypothetical protein
MLLHGTPALEVRSCLPSGEDEPVGTLLVLAIAVGVGVLVYRLTATEPVEAPGAGEHGGREPGTGDSTTSTGDHPAAAGPPERVAPEGYIPVVPGRANWHSRLGGAMGLVIAVAVGAVALALSVWALVEFISRMFSDAGGAASGA